jgi:hypothetical protein
MPAEKTQPFCSYSRVLNWTGKGLNTQGRLHQQPRKDPIKRLRYRQLGHHFMKTGDFEDISVSKILHFALGEGLENDSGKGLHKRSCPLFYILF